MKKKLSQSGVCASLNTSLKVGSSFESAPIFRTQPEKVANWVLAIKYS